MRRRGARGSDASCPPTGFCRTYAIEEETMKNIIKSIAALAAWTLLPGSGGAQTLFCYSGADRMERIFAAAKKEDVDLIHFGSPEMEALSREKILQAVNSPVHKDLQPGSVPAHREWAATLLSVWVQVYNTNLIRKSDLPRTYADLLDPKWKGKLGIEAKNQDWFASVVDVMGGGEKGLRVFRELVARNGISARTGHTLLNNMVIVGLEPPAPTVYNYMPEQAKKKGAPIDWFALKPTITHSNTIDITRRARHPGAALLFYEYMLGEG